MNWFQRLMAMTFSDLWRRVTFRKPLKDDQVLDDEDLNASEHDLVIDFQERLNKCLKIMAEPYSPGHLPVRLVPLTGHFDVETQMATTRFQVWWNNGLHETPVLQENGEPTPDTLKVMRGLTTPPSPPPSRKERLRAAKDLQNLLNELD